MITEEMELFHVNSDDLSEFSLWELEVLQTELSQQIEGQKDIKDLVLSGLSHFPAPARVDHTLSIVECGGETLAKLECLLEETQEHIQVLERINEMVK